MHNYSTLRTLKTPVRKASTTIGFDLITSLHSSEMMPKFKTVLNHDRLETKSNQSSQLPFAGDGGV